LTTSPTLCVRVPWHVTRLVVDYFAYTARPGASPHRAARRKARRRLIRLRRASGCLGTSRGSSSTTSPTPRIRVPRHVARLVMRLVVDYFAYAARPSASVRRAARCRLLRLCRASGCLGTSRDLSCGSSSTTSPTPRVRVPQHVAWLVARLVVDYFASCRLVVDYFACVVHLDAPSRRSSSHRSAALALTMRPVTLSHGSTTPCTDAAISSCGRTGSTSATPCVTTTCLVATSALLRVRRAPSRHRLSIASRLPLISTSFSN
jgi:hypothetical protein